MAPASGRQLTPRARRLAAAALTAVLVPLWTSAASAAGPSWSQLTPGERQILAPLQPDWETYDAQRKQKWRGIAERYPKMTAIEQQRVQEQMRPWATLSPQERAAAREQYKTLNKLPPEKKQDVRQKWELYQNLPPEERQKLGAKPVAPAAKPAAPDAQPAPGPVPPPQSLGPVPPPQSPPSSAPAGSPPPVNR